MNAPLEVPLAQIERVAGHIAVATESLAPTWPLDELIAVNPYWGWIRSPMPEAAAALGMLAGTRLTMPREWFHEQWNTGRLKRQHLEAAAEAEGVGHVVEELVAMLEQQSAPIARMPLIPDLREAGEPPRPGMSWTELVTHQISQHCAAFFDRDQAAWTMDTSPGLFESWRQQIASDRGLPWRQGRAAVRAQVLTMPSEPQVLVAAALDALGVPEAGRDAYLTALLMAVGGWAAWCAYERWQARLRGSDDAHIVHLLAIRLAWEWLLHDDAAPGALPSEWAAQWGKAVELTAALQQGQRADWLLQRAMELAFQQPLIEKLRAKVSAAEALVPAVQAVFCIDVRSEVFRRALESISPSVHTRGFAGFFGLPIAYSPIGSALRRPQLPGLLAPVQCVSEGSAHATLGRLVKRRRNALQWRQRWAKFRASAASAFSFVESMGLFYGGKLVSSSLHSARAPTRWEDAGLPTQAAAELRPRLPQATADPAAAAVMAQGILTAMGLTRDFAPLVLVVGHGSQTANNPHAAGLDCGACGGQTGEVNARVLADLLNTPNVRQHLNDRGVAIPAHSHFLPAVHNTTTDEVRLYDTDAVPAGLRAELDRLRAWLMSAGESARTDRAPSLGLQNLVGQPDKLKRALLKRGNDWAQVRPEWGLADNAAFIVAPRARTRHINLAGRSFLHDYDWRLDRDLGVLTLIMTAPMVVTHWINMQYYGSTVDNRRYGSGNKLLHNVVGGRIGVFEGNGGDLRIGLPIQSLHDGRQLRHTPLRLSVFIEAPHAAIDAVISRHEVVRDLVDNGWLHLFRIDSEHDDVEEYRKGVWVRSAKDA